MTDKLIKEALTEINSESFYFREENRKWGSYDFVMKPDTGYELSVIPTFKMLKIIDDDSKLNPLLEKAGLFVILNLLNEEQGQIVPRFEVLFSPMGLKFLKIMDTKLFMIETGISYLEEHYKEKHEI